MSQPTPEPLPPEHTPGAMQTVKERALPSGHTVTFEYSPCGWLTQRGTPRRQDWRRYFIAHADEKRVEVPSVSTICDRILPKPGLIVWSERAGIVGGVEAIRRGLISPDALADDAVRAVRANRLGADAARDEAADRGLNVHAILERYSLTGEPPNPADHPQPHRPFIRGLVKWLLHADPEPVAVEMLVADPDRGYAGRLDLLARIDGKLVLVDLKTQERGATYESSQTQCVLYREAESRYGEHAIEASRIVVVDGYGSYREMPLLATSETARLALDFYAAIRPLTAACDQANRIYRFDREEALKS